MIPRRCITGCKYVYVVIVEVILWSCQLFAWLDSLRETTWRCDLPLFPFKFTLGASECILPVIRVDFNVNKAFCDLL
jgi:hypothetical protein